MQRLSSPVLPVRLRFLPWLCAACLLVWTILQSAEAMPANAAVDEPRHVVLDDEHDIYRLGQHLRILEDPQQQLTLDEVRDPANAARFSPSEKDVPNFGFSPSAYWVRVDLERRTIREQVWMLEFGYAPMQYVDIYTIAADGEVSHQHGGSAIPYDQRPYRHHKHVFRLSLPAGEVTTLFVRVAGDTSKNIPLRLYKAEAFSSATSLELAMLSLYTGLILGLFFYNLFIYRSLREPAYLFYLAFLISFLTMGMSINGLFQAVVLPGHPSLAMKMTAFSTAFGPACALLFSQYFLETRTRLPRAHRVLQAGTAWMLMASLLAWVADYQSSIVLATASALVLTIILMTVAIVAFLHKVPSANYFLLAWVALLLGVILNVARLLGLLPNNPITEYAHLWGSAAEAILLSVGLAARMRSLRDEKEAAWQLAINNELKALQSERIASQSQKQLVKQEQLATLGLLSASVAHEINNPNQFISVSAQTLEKRIDEFQSFIRDLMVDDPNAEITEEFDKRFHDLRNHVSLVREGSHRIAGIVKGMRNNSRQDQGEAQHFDPVEAMLSTLELIRPGVAGTLSINADGLQRGFRIKGYPARINQVFTNLLVNACHAIETARQQGQDGGAGSMTLWTQSASGMVAIAIEDNGCGMTPEVKARLFEPFFTTKGADKGTGLGLGICRTIVEEHGGRLEVESTPGKGSLFRVILPLAEGGRPVDA